MKITVNVHYFIESNFMTTLQYEMFLETSSEHLQTSSEMQIFLIQQMSWLKDGSHTTFKQKAGNVH